ncbi:hypothetical protein V8F20_000795 [Naviculisporaceae sp. PSN 640]
MDQPRISSFRDLTEAQKELTDDIIRAVELANKGPIPADEDMPSLRERLWEKVFDDWNTAQIFPITHPGRMPKKSADKSRLQIGVLSRDHPASAAAKAKAAKKNTETITHRPRIPAHRRGGQPVYMRPNINWNSGGLPVYMTIDSRGAGVKPEFIQYRNGWTRLEAEAEAGKHWDRHEKRIVWDHNIELGIYWARRRLLLGMKERGMLADDRQIPEEDENPDDLVQLRTCYELHRAHSVEPEHVRRLRGELITQYSLYRRF